MLNTDALCPASRARVLAPTPAATNEFYAQHAHLGENLELFAFSASLGRSRFGDRAPRTTIAAAAAPRRARPEKPPTIPPSLSPLIGGLATVAKASIARLVAGSRKLQKTLTFPAFERNPYRLPEHCRETPRKLSVPAEVPRRTRRESMHWQPLQGHQLAERGRA